MKAKLVKFDDDGKQCKNDIEYLRRHPECGVIFIQDKPFKPVNPPHNFKPRDRQFRIDTLDRAIPSDPFVPPVPEFTKFKGLPEVVGQNVFDGDYLKQDYTNYALSGRRLFHDESPHSLNADEYISSRISNAFNRSGYGLVPRIGNDNYSHETRESGRPVGEVELQDFGAGVGIPNEAPPPTLRSSRIRPLADPRDIEFAEDVRPRGMTDEELIDAQIEQLTRNLPQKEAKQVESSIRKGKRKAKIVEQEMFPIEPIDEYKVVADRIEEILGREADQTLTIRQKDNLVREMQNRGISQERVEQILEEANAFDFGLEEAIGSSSRPQVERIARLLGRGLRSIPRRDTNLLPARQEEIELREYTPLTRGRTDLAPGRSRYEKIIDKTASRLPEEFRTTIGSAKRNMQEFNENIRTKSLDAIQRIKLTSTRIFGQKYARITETRVPPEVEMRTINAPDGNISVRPPVTEDITGIRPGDLQALDFDPLGEAYAEGFSITRPNLTYAQRLRAGAFSREAGVGGAGAVGGVLAGFGTSILMKKAGVKNDFAIAAGSGASGGTVGRILTMAGTKALTTSTEAVAARTATQVAIRGGTSLLRSAGEGAVVGVVLMPVDILLNNFLVGHGFNHVNANLTSGAVVGGAGVAATTIGLASLGAAPETMGASLVIGGLAIAATEIIGIFTGAEQDKEEAENKAKIINFNEANKGRQLLLESLPKYDYDFDKALKNYSGNLSLGINNDTWDSFVRNSKQMFNKKPNLHPPPRPNDGGNISDDDKRTNDLFTKYITHTLIKKICTESDCTELKRHDEGELTDEERQFLEKQTSGTWQNQADMQVTMSIQELDYSRKRIANAQSTMIDAWNNEQKIESELDPYIVQTAYLDPTFEQRYTNALKLDAQQQVVDAYQSNQTKIENLPRNIRKMANLDADFNKSIHEYYESIETIAGHLDITIPQVIQLQSLTGEEQKNKYEEFQFDNIKQDDVVVAEAKEIAQEEDQVRAAEFYDIDQAYLETDPTAITSWNPSDSQILQAYNAGMTLKEYTDYMHELAKGESGNFSNLPVYTQEQIKKFTDEDVAHFEDELAMSGHSGLYTFDYKNRIFVLNSGGENNINNPIISRYTPKYLLQARAEYADMIHGLNQENQAKVDNYNANLMRELSSYGKHYDSMVAQINDERLYQGRSDLLYYDVGKAFNANKIDFTPMSDSLKDIPIDNQAIATGRQLGQKVSIKENYGLSDTDYKDVKLNIQNKNIVNPTEEQVNQAVKEVREVSETSEQ